MHKEVSRWFADYGDINLRLDYQFDSNDLIMDIGTYTGQDLKKLIPNLLILNEHPQSHNNNKLLTFIRLLSLKKFIEKVFLV